MFRSLVLLMAAGAACGAAPASAQNAAAGQKYGLGVHDYFAGDYAQAYEQLTAAIQGGSNDPRAYYFRGLAYLKLGRGPEAAQDFRAGSQLETSNTNKFYSVSKALERVQGSARVELERYRVDARMAALERDTQLRKARYEAIRREESRVLREKPLTAPEPIETPAPVAETQAEPKAVDSPAAPEKAPAAKTVEKEAKESGEVNPFFVPPKKRPDAKDAVGAMGKALGKALGKAVAGQKDGPQADEKPAEAANPFGDAPADEPKPANPDDPFAK